MVIYDSTTLLLDDEAVLFASRERCIAKNGKPYIFTINILEIVIFILKGGTFDMNGGDFPYNNTAMSIGHAEDIQLIGVTFKI